MPRLDCYETLQSSVLDKRKTILPLRS